jgi:AcrR family transcriptional regulator
MTRAAKTAGIQRRTPQRDGSRETVSVIFEATARILAAHGRAGLNTNRIAEVAGISVGGLYGYFPNKEAILLAMARQELDLVRDRVLAALTRGDDADVHPVRRAIRALIKSYGTRSKVRRILMETLFAQGGSEDMARPVYEVAEVILAHAGDILPKGAVAPSHIGLFVLTRAVDGVIRTATYEGVDFLTSQTFEDELMRLVMGYFASRDEGASL